MSYKTEGFVGGLVLPMTNGKSTIKFKLSPTGDYTHEMSTGRKTLLVDGNKALMADIDDEFSVETSNGCAFVSTLVALKTTKAKVGIECDKSRNVSKITVL